MPSVIRAFPGLPGPERRKRKEERKEREERGKRGMTGWHEYSTHRLCNCWRAYGVGWGWRLVGGRGSGNIRMCSLWKQQMENECMSPKVCVCGGGWGNKGVDGVGRKKRVKGRFREGFLGEGWERGEPEEEILKWVTCIAESAAYWHSTGLLLNAHTHTHTHARFNKKPFSAWGVLKAPQVVRREKDRLCIYAPECVSTLAYMFFFSSCHKNQAPFVL